MLKVFIEPHVDKTELVADNSSTEKVEDEVWDDYVVASIDEYTIFETLYADSE